MGNNIVEAFGLTIRLGVVSGCTLEFGVDGCGESFHEAICKNGAAVTGDAGRTPVVGDDVTDE